MHQLSRNRSRSELRRWQQQRQEMHKNTRGSGSGAGSRTWNLWPRPLAAPAPLVGRSSIVTRRVHLGCCVVCGSPGRWEHRGQALGSSICGTGAPPRGCSGVLAPVMLACCPAVGRPHAPAAGLLPPADAQFSPPPAWKVCICMSDTCADHRPSARLGAQVQPERHSTRAAPMPS